MSGTIDLKVDGKPYKVNWGGKAAPTLRDIEDIEATIRRDNPQKPPDWVTRGLNQPIRAKSPLGSYLTQADKNAPADIARGKRIRKLAEDARRTEAVSSEVEAIDSGNMRALANQQNRGVPIERQVPVTPEDAYRIGKGSTGIRAEAGLNLANAIALEMVTAGAGHILGPGLAAASRSAKISRKVQDAEELGMSIAEKTGATYKGLNEAGKPVISKKALGREVKPEAPKKAIKPPQRVKPDEVPTVQPRQASIKKVREETGRPEYKRKVIGTKDAIEGGRKIYAEGNAPAITQQFKEGKIKALSGEETVALDLRGNELLERIAKETDTAKVAQYDDELDDVLDALNKSGTQQSADFRARQLEYRRATDELVMMARSQKNKGGKLTPEERAEVVRLGTEVKRLQGELDIAQQQAARAEADAMVRRAVKSNVKGAIKGKLNVKVTTEDLESAWKELTTPSSSNVGAGLGAFADLPKKAQALHKVALHYVERGQHTAEEIYKLIKEKAADLPDVEVWQAIRNAAGVHGREINKGRKFGEDIQISGTAGIQSREVQDARIALDKAKKASDQYIEAFKPASTFDKITDAVNIPRAFQSSGDASTWFRQLAVLGIPNPVQGVKAIAKGIKPTFSQRAAEYADDALRNADPVKHARREQAKLYIAPIETLKVLKGEEAFIGRRYAEKVPVLGSLVKGANRNAVITGNELRAKLFDAFADANPNATLDELTDYADYLNKGSGRGSLGQFEQAAGKLSSWFFSPRFMASRFQTPAKMFTAKGAAKKQIIKDFTKYSGVVSGTLAIAAMNGASVELDPRSSDFLKMRIGDKVIDVFSGFAQTYRMMARLVRAGYDRARGYEPEDPQDIVIDFLKYKQSPQVGLLREALTGEDAVGQKVEGYEYLFNIAPIWVEEAYQMFSKDKLSAKETAAMSALNFIGFGTSNYPKKELPKLKRIGRKKKKS